MVTHSEDDKERSGDEAQEEAQRTREELAALHRELDTRGRRKRRVTWFRSIAAAVLVVVAALGATASVIGVWAGRTTLNTDRWVETVTPLAESPAVRAAVSAYTTDQIFKTLNVDQRVSQALPPKAAFLSPPLTGQVHGFVQSSVNKVLASPEFARLWPQVNRVAHQQVMTILDKNSQVVKNSGQTVTLNLLPVVNNVLGQLEKQAPTLFGKPLNLPPITNGQIPAGLRTKIQTSLGVTLPANFAAIPVYRGDQITAAQNAVVQIKKGLGLIVGGSVVALVLALWISPRRRRTTLQLGLWLVISVVALTSLLRAIRTQLIDQVPGGVLRNGVDAGVQIVFVTLRQRGTQLLWLGIVIALVAYLVGPGRGAVAVRRGAAVVGERARRYGAVAVAHGPDLARAHRDQLRIGGVVAAGVLLLFFTSWTSLFVIALLLGVYELLVAAVAAAGQEPAAGRASSAQSGRWTGSTA